MLHIIFHADSHRAWNQFKSRGVWEQTQLERNVWISIFSHLIKRSCALWFNKQCRVRGGKRSRWRKGWVVLPDIISEVKAGSKITLGSHFNVFHLKYDKIYNFINCLILFRPICTYLFFFYFIFRRNYRNWIWHAVIECSLFFTDWFSIGPTSYWCVIEYRWSCLQKAVTEWVGELKCKLVEVGQTVESVSCAYNRSCTPTINKPPWQDSAICQH